jgi:hypothetical protein
MSDCQHEGFHSGEARYEHASGRLRYVVACDTCGDEIREIEVLDYQPAYDPRGNGAQLAA